MTNLAVKNASFLRMANGRVHCAFRLGGRCYSNFNDSPAGFVERTGTVTFLSQFLKGLPIRCPNDAEKDSTLLGTGGFFIYGSSL